MPEKGAGLLLTQVHESPPSTLATAPAGNASSNHTILLLDPVGGSRLVEPVKDLKGATLFGAIHLLAWSFAFPTPVERLLWRISALLTATVPVVAEISFADLLGGEMKLWLDDHIGYGCLNWLWRKFLQILALTYVLARLFVLVEVFRTLYFLPPEAYLTTWSANVPHVS